MGMKQKLVNEDEEKEKPKMTTKNTETHGFYFLGQSSKQWANWVAWIQIIVNNIAMSIHVASLIMVVVPLTQGRVPAEDPYSILNPGYDKTTAAYSEVTQGAVKLLIASVQCILGVVLLQGVGKDNKTKIKAWIIGTVFMTIISFAFILATSCVFSTSISITSNEMGSTEVSSSSSTLFPNLYFLILWNMPWILLTIYFLWIVSIHLKEVERELECLQCNLNLNLPRTNNDVVKSTASDYNCDCDCDYNCIVGPNRCVCRCSNYSMYPDSIRVVRPTNNIEVLI